MFFESKAQRSCVQMTPPNEQKLGVAAQAYIELQPLRLFSAPALGQQSVEQKSNKFAQVSSIPMPDVHNENALGVPKLDMHSKLLGVVAEAGK